MRERSYTKQTSRTHLRSKGRGNRRREAEWQRALGAGKRREGETESLTAEGGTNRGPGAAAMERGEKKKERGCNGRCQGPPDRQGAKGGGKEGLNEPIWARRTVGRGGGGGRNREGALCVVPISKRGSMGISEKESTKNIRKHGGRDFSRCVRMIPKRNKKSNGKSRVEDR